MKLAKYAFLIAGVYGVLTIVPLYFLEARMATEYPPALTHPEHYYSFIGVTLVWQILFLFISRNPLRFRPVMPFCVLEKLSLIPTFLILTPHGRFPQIWIPLLVLDLVFGALFLISYVRTRDLQPAEAVS